MKKFQLFTYATPSADIWVSVDILQLILNLSNTCTSKYCIQGWMGSKKSLNSEGRARNPRTYRKSYPCCP